MGDFQVGNGVVSLAQLQTRQVFTTSQSTFEDLDSVAYVPGSNAGVLGNGSSQNIVPFSVSGTAIAFGTSVDISKQCVGPALCYGAAVVMPNPSTAIVSLNSSGSSYLLEVGNPSGTPTFSQLAFGPKVDDTAGLAMSSDGHVVVARGGYFDVFVASGGSYNQVSQIVQADGPDHASLRGREGMDVFKATGGDYELLAASTSSGPQNGTLSLFAGLQNGNSTRTTSTRIDPASHAYAVTTDGTTAFVGTDVGIAIVPGVNTQTFAPDTTSSSIVSPVAGIGGTMAQVSTLALTPNGKWLVVMGLASGASGPGGQGYLDVLPVIYSGGSVTLGPAVESVPITVPTNDQLVVY